MKNRKVLSVTVITVLLAAGTAMALSPVKSEVIRAPWIFEQAVTFLKAITVGGDVTLSGNTTLGDAATDTVTVTGTVQGATPLIFEGATADDYETILAITDPTADTTVTIADQATGSIMVSSLATNAPSVANSVTGASNSMVWEGSADAHEIVIDAADATADVVYRLADAAAATYGLVSSTLATNAANIANSIWGGTNQLIFEGATADDYETIITPTDATADQTLTTPDDSGALVFSPGGGTTVAGDALVIPVTHAYVAKTTAGDAEALTLANGENGQILTIDLATDGGGDGTLTPTTKSGFTSIVFADAGDNATLMYIDDTVGWIIQGTAGVAAPPVIVD